MASKLISVLIVALLALLCIGFFYSGVASIDLGGVVEDEGVLVLDEATFDTVIGQEPFVLVEFYAPWCGHCKKLAPEYVKVAAQLADNEAEYSGAKVAKVDCTVEKDLCSKYGVTGFPTLKFFRSGTPVDYSGGREANDLLNYLRAKTQPAVVQLKSADELTKLVSGNDVVVVGHFADESSAAYKAFNQVASASDEIRFAASVGSSSLLEDVSGSANGVVLFKNFDDKKVVYSGEYTADSLGEFVSDNSQRLLNDFLLSQKLFQLPVKKHVFVFIGKEETAEQSTEFNRIFDVARQIAAQYKGQVVFSHVNVSHPQAARIVEFFDITTTPQLFFVDLNDNKKKYKLPGDITLDNAAKFVKDAFAGNAKIFSKSEEVQEYSGSGVRTLVGTDHDSIVYDASKTVFVEYYAPWCGHCKQLAPIWDQLAAENTDSSLVIAKLDGTKNDVANVGIQGFPTLYLYPQGEDKKPVLYQGGRDLASLKEYLANHAAGTAESVDEPSEDL